MRGTEQGRDDRRDHAGVEPVLRGHAGDGGKGDSLREGDQRSGYARDGIRAVTCAHIGQPGQEWK